MLDFTPRNWFLGVTTIGVVVAASIVGIVRAEGTRPDNSGIFRCTSGLACLEGNSTVRTTLGVLGISRGEGIEGVTFSEVGKAGVRGASRETIGIGYGVFGTSLNGDGVVGVSHAVRSAGVHALSDKGDGIIAESRGTDAVAFRAEADKSSTAIFVGHNSANFAHCVIDRNANLSCTGFVQSSSALESEHRDSNGRRVVAYGSESTSASIDDVGTARMTNGIANVPIARDFGAMIDRRRYYVFLTPLGETRGLYVSRKTASGFQVRELGNGVGSVDFDYRIVAHPIDAPSTRLPLASQ